MALKMDGLAHEPVGYKHPNRGDVWNDYEWVTPERYERQRKTGLKMKDGKPLPPIQPVHGEAMTDCRVPHPKVDPCHNCDTPEADHEGPRNEDNDLGWEMVPARDTTPTGMSDDERLALHGGDCHHYAWREGDPVAVPEPAPLAAPAAAYGQAPAGAPAPAYASGGVVPGTGVAPPEPLLAGERPLPAAARTVQHRHIALPAMLKHAARHLLEGIGENPERGGLLETPDRVAKAWLEWTRGYGADPAAILKVFEDGAEECDEMVVVSGIPVYSHCEHHMAAIFGEATVGYIPGEEKRIIGLSKMSRLVDIFAKRLQVQERMTNQIATAMMENLLPLGCGVVIKARHMCMESRGVKQAGTVTITSAMRGVFKTMPSTRAEFLSLAR